MTDTVPQQVAAAYARGFFTAVTQGKPLGQAHKLGLKMVAARSVSENRLFWTRNHHQLTPASRSTAMGCSIVAL
jgi:hypothetical protein